MATVARGVRVQWSVHTPGRTRFEQGSTSLFSGLALDKGPGVGEWWVMPSGDTRAQLVHRSQMKVAA